MKLRNKKTGEIKDWCFSEAFSLWTVERLGPDGCSLEDFIANIERFRNEWEVTPEGKEWPQIDDKYFYITWAGEVRNDSWVGCDTERHSLEIGNVFRTKEEAEEAVRKLKALKRLRDAGLSFDGWGDSPRAGETDCIAVDIVYHGDPIYEGISDDLDLLFGEENDA